VPSQGTPASALGALESLVPHEAKTTVGKIATTKRIA
jgi:hypothetical protein